MNNWSLHLNPEAGQESEAWLAQKARWPGACHDGINTLFCDTNELETDAILIVQGEEETEDELMTRFAAALFVAERPPLHANGRLFDELFRTPMYRLWCGTYQTKEELEEDHEAVFGVGVDRRKSLDTLNAMSRATIKAYFTGA